MHPKIFIIAALFLITPLTSSAASFIYDLKLGDTHKDVKTLQSFLNVRGYMVTNPGEETNYFGPATEAALSRYQTDNAAQLIGEVGVLNNVGTLNPLTRRALERNSGAVLGLSTSVLNSNLSVGQESAEVKLLQTFLNKNGFMVSPTGSGSPGLETTYYGPATAEAVKRYQEAYKNEILLPNGLSRGTGVVATSTRVHLNTRVRAELAAGNTTVPAPIMVGDTSTLSVVIAGLGVVVANEHTCTTPSCVFTFPPQTKITLTALPSAGYVFMKWGGACSTSGSSQACTTTLSTYKFVSAIFRKTDTTLPSTYTLTTAVSGNGSVASSPAGILCGSDCTETYTPGTLVTLTPTPATGYRFIGWTGDCTGAYTCVTPLDQARSVTASFAVEPGVPVICPPGTVVSGTKCIAAPLPPVVVGPVCAQPPMPVCKKGMVCTAVMPQPKTYSSYDAMVVAKATLLYKGSCIPGDSGSPTTTTTTFTLDSGTYERSVYSIDRTRPYLLYVPKSYTPKTATELVLFYDGGGGDMKHASRAYEWKEEAEKQGFIVAFMNGTSNLKSQVFSSWNAGSCCDYGRDNNIDDITYTKLVVSDIMKDFNIKKGATFGSGFSNGSMLLHKLACEAPEIFRAVGGSSGTDGTYTCPHPIDIPFMYLHAKNDTHVLFNGGAGVDAFPDPSKVTEFLSVPSTTKNWVERYKLSPKPKRVLEKSGVYCDLYTGTKSTGKFKLCVTETGGHSWAGAPRESHSGAVPSTAIQATAEFWKFFEEALKTN